MTRRILDTLSPEVTSKSIGEGKRTDTVNCMICGKYVASNSTTEPFSAGYHIIHVINPSYGPEHWQYLTDCLVQHMYLEHKEVSSAEFQQMFFDQVACSVCLWNIAKQCLQERDAASATGVLVATCNSLHMLERYIQQNSPGNAIHLAETLQCVKRVAEGCFGDGSTASRDALIADAAECDQLSWWAYAREIKMANPS